MLLRLLLVRMVMLFCVIVKRRLCRLGILMTLCVRRIRSTVNLRMFVITRFVLVSRVMISGRSLLRRVILLVPRRRRIRRFIVLMVR